MLILGACLVVIFIAAVGYWLVKFNVNLVFMSVAIDYFQVVSIFLQSKIQWPAAVKQLMYILSAFNLNLDIVAPECLLPEVSYVDKFYTIQLFPLALLALLGISSAAYTAYKYWILRRTSKEHLYRHVPTNRAVALVILYFFYLYLTKTTLDVYNCAPTVPPTYDSTGKLMKYLSTQFEECGKPGGIQARLIPYSVLALCIYTLGFPAALGWLLYTHRLPIMFDQLLRAKGQGQNRFQNPYAYSIRKSYSRLYYQFKPNFFFWSLVILLRKFLIATTSVMFTTNPSFQMSTCLLILFLSYSLQVRLNPYMSYSDYAVVLEEHQDMQGWSALHRQLHAMLVTVESRNYKKYYKNILVGGRMNRAALLKAIGSWLFNYNTVEAVLLFCGIILCLMGVMLQSQMLDKGGYDTITGVILTILVASILYLFAIFCIEVYIAVTARRHSIHLPHIKTVRFEETGIPPAEMSETNPILLRGKLADQVQIEAFEEAPPKEVWTLFRETFKQQQTTIQDLNGEISAMKKQVSSRSDVVLMDAFRPRTVAIKKEMRTGMVELTPRGMKGISV
jgi:hypothetical protein